MADYKVFGIHMGKANCSVDLSNGSERGEYVNQDYILNKLGRPHRAVNLMYCYYPLDEGFPVRASVAFPSKDTTNAWGFPYDDYYTYGGGLNGSPDAPVFEQMRDIRRHGQDVILTLTLDPNVSDEHLIAIAKDLLPFGRLMIRINHEATGNWFSFNKRCTYQEVGAFFARFAKIIHEYAPNVKTILCAGCYDPATGKLEKEEEFAEAAKETDIWSIDKYMALHWGWPYDIAEQGGHSFGYTGAETVYKSLEETYDRYKESTGMVKPMVMSEHNADGDVTGPYDQCKIMRHFCDMVVDKKATWIEGFALYQFRDRGRLGLELEDPNNPEVGIEQPLMAEYKKIIHEDWFEPKMDYSGEVKLPVTVRWGGSEDSDGIAIPLKFEDNPTFCELWFDEDDESNMMIELNDRWFYKSPKAKYVDLMPAFYENPLDGKTKLSLKIFCPPATGENESGAIDSYATIEKLPKIRIAYEPCIPFTN
ncbi:MAG: hypothetical protein LUH18_00315 [Oscillospiraceae bacterium]|nr:hypothetical protein [Oscillospiraceae bacterium]